MVRDILLFLQSSNCCACSCLSTLSPLSSFQSDGIGKTELLFPTSSPNSSPLGLAFLVHTQFMQCLTREKLTLGKGSACRQYALSRRDVLLKMSWARRTALSNSAMTSGDTMAFNRVECQLFLGCRFSLTHQGLLHLVSGRCCMYCRCQKMCAPNCQCNSSHQWMGDAMQEGCL